MSALSNNSIPSLLPLSLLIFYQPTSKMVAFYPTTGLQLYLYMIWEMISPLAIRLHTAACGIDVLPFAQTSVETVVKYINIAIALHHSFLLYSQCPSVHLCPEWWVYPTKVKPQQKTLLTSVLPYLHSSSLHPSVNQSACPTSSSCMSYD